MPYWGTGRGKLGGFRLCHAGASSSPLLTGLISYWKLEEASGTRVDSHGANNLTDVNTVTQGTGVIGNCGQFTSASGEYLSITDNASLSVINTSWTWSLWARLDTLIQAYALAKWAGVGNGAYYIHTVGASPNTKWRVNLTTGGAQYFCQANAFGNIVVNTWYHVVGMYDSVAQQLSIRINDGTANVTNSVPVNADDTAAFNIGRNPGVGGLWNGRIDEVGFWKRILTAGEITQLYNGGAGLAYPFN